MELSNKNKVFEEIQQFGKGWTLLLYLPLGMVSLLMLYACFRQFIMGQPFGDHPAPDAVLAFITLLVLGLLVSLILMRLETRVDEWGAGFRWRPFMKKMRMHNRSNIEKAEVIDYGFVGYGIRLSRHGWVHNTSGKMGLKLTMKNKRSIVLGTQKPEELSAYIRENWKETIPTR